MEEFMKLFDFEGMVEENEAEFRQLIGYTIISKKFPNWYTYLTEEMWEVIQKCFVSTVEENVHTAVLFLRGLIAYLAAQGEPELGDIAAVYDSFLP